MSVAPAVPSFGFSLPGPVTQANAVAPAPTPLADPKQKAKRKHNVLGLTPKGADREDSDQEIDEEAALAAHLLVQSGALPNVNNRAEMVAWLAERKKRYPTKARLEERQKAEQDAELERLKHRVKASRDANQSKVAQAANTSPTKQTKEQKQRARLERHLLKAEKLQRHLAQAHSVNGSATDEKVGNVIKPSLLGENYESDDEVDKGSNPQSESSSDSVTSSDSDSGSDTSTSDSSEDEAPEEASSKQAPPVQKPQPERKPKEREPVPEHLIPWIKRGFCRDFIQHKPCRYGNRCRKKHKIPQEVRDMKLPRIRLFDRLAQQEIDSENMAAVNAIKVLGATGFFNSE